MEYIDLGLPSGNLWAAENIEDYCDFNNAVTRYGDNIPTREDFEELFQNCEKKWDDERKGLVLVANNGAKLFLPALGYQYISSIYGLQIHGYYWTSTPSTTNFAYFAYFHSHQRESVDSDGLWFYEKSVRLIKIGGTK